MLPLITSAVAALDAVTTEAKRLTDPGEQKIRVGMSPLIAPDLVARSFEMVREPPVARDLVLREADMEALRAELRDGTLDIILIPAVAAMPRYEHRVIDVEPIIVVGSGGEDDQAPLELTQAGHEQFILVPDSCGLTTFTDQLFQSREMPLRANPGEAATYGVLQAWAQLGLGAAMVPQSKLASPDTPCRPLVDDGREVQISFEAVGSADSPLATDLLRLADGLAAPRQKAG
ncbi:substrate-binding domain-containing protein [Streptomyces sp. NPDC059690]|uniref:substrate-binding domain-containing protein n=1 Tax=Streptomyces sp. NPDC059690 TaxID=3346907 RepID=UPI003688DA38